MQQSNLKSYSFSGPGYSCSPARYAKGKMVLRIEPDGSGFKTEGTWLAEALGGKWIGRSNGYHISPKRSTQWFKLHKAGFGTSRRYFGGDDRPYTFSRNGGPELSLKDALIQSDLSCI